MRQFSVLFCCMGNICRSPTAEGVFRVQLHEAGLASQVHVDSAGTHGYHIGEPPDARSQRHALKRGYDLSRQRAREVRAADFEAFDLILAMDFDNLARLEQECPPERRRKLRLFMSFAPQAGSAVVPDPYYSGADGFEAVLDLVEQASRGLLAHVQQELQAQGA
uniref:protein-tyrosine-phosphatase n=1 Tax=mine drainage metagenome TaxID=410659 RepID=E6PT05_9ZZZZ